MHVFFYFLDFISMTTIGSRSAMVYKDPKLEVVANPWKIIHYPLTSVVSCSNLINNLYFCIAYLRVACWTLANISSGFWYMKSIT